MLSTTPNVMNEQGVHSMFEIIMIAYALISYILYAGWLIALKLEIAQ